MRLTADGAVRIVRRAQKRVGGTPIVTRDGAVAQLGERRVRNAKVRGSIPLGSTKAKNLCLLQRVARRKLVRLPRPSP